MTDHWVYRCFDGELRLLYVGITSEGIKRFRTHGNDKTWWPEVDTIKLEHFDTVDDARERERALIAELRPPHNTRLVGPEPDPVVAHMYRRCRVCRSNYRPPRGYRHKATCPACLAARRVANGSQA